MSDDNELTEMPWGGILKLAAQAAAVVGGAVLVTFTAIARSELNRQREERRPRWTDEHRFDTRPR